MYSRPQQIGRAFRADHGQANKAAQFAKIQRTCDGKAVERIIEKKRCADGGCDSAHHGRQAAVERSHKGRRQEVKEDEVLRSDRRSPDPPQNRGDDRYNGKRHDHGYRPFYHPHASPPNGLFPP